MINPFRRQTHIAIKRVKKKKSPFIYKAYSSKPKHKWLRRRKRNEWWFRRAGLLSIMVAFLFLIGLGWNILSNGVSAFWEAQIKVPVTFDAELVANDSYKKIIQNGLLELFPDVESRREKRELFSLMSRNAHHQLKDMLSETPEFNNTKQDLWLPAASAASIFYKKRLYEQLKYGGKISEEQAAWITRLAKADRIEQQFNMSFFQNGDSREAEISGVLASTIGSFLTILVCVTLAFPLGVATAVYLEEFARKSWFTDIIEININNLAAVPSIIFGLLGLSVYLNFFGLPRSSSLVGGMVLALLILPVIVIATRNALQAVPSSIRYAAAALGATPTQVVFHHTLIYALPGIMTGVILSVARAFGETAPLLMIGMVAFIVDIPKGITDPATTLPVQVYLWSNNPELGFVEKTAAAILVLLAFMVLINLLAIYIRKRFEIKW